MGMNSLTRLGVVLLAFAGIVLLIPLVDSSPDATTGPIGGAMAIVGLLLVVVGITRKTAT